MGIDLSKQALRQGVLLQQVPKQADYLENSAQGLATLSHQDPSLETSGSPLPADYWCVVALSLPLIKKADSDCKL